MRGQPDTAGRCLARLLTNTDGIGPLRVWSLIVTLYGDAILPRGGSLWLGDLTAVMQPLGVDSGAVRTALSRLTGDGWMVSGRVSRKAYYRLSDEAAQISRLAEPRIYGAASVRRDWDGQVRLAIIQNGAADRAALRSRVETAGFKAINATAFASFDSTDTARRLESEGVLLLETKAEGASLAALAEACFGLQKLEADYLAFEKTFTPLLTETAALKDAAPPAALALRMLVVHAYRRIALRGQPIPAELLPPDWPGHRAREIARRIYMALAAASEARLDGAEGEHGALPHPTRPARKRFGA